jgi:hypothetical protein
MMCRWMIVSKINDIIAMCNMSANSTNSRSLHFAALRMTNYANNLGDRH